MRQSHRLQRVTTVLVVVSTWTCCLFRCPHFLHGVFPVVRVFFIELPPEFTREVVRSMRDFFGVKGDHEVGLGTAQEMPHLILRHFSSSVSPISNACRMTPTFVPRRRAATLLIRRIRSAVRVKLTFFSFATLSPS